MASKTSNGFVGNPSGNVVVSQSKATPRNGFHSGIDQLTKPYAFGDRFKNHKNDYHWIIHGLQTIFDLRKGALKNYTNGSSPILVPKHVQSGDTSGPYIQWLGHASFLLQARGSTILTDPNFSDVIKLHLPLYGEIPVWHRLTPPAFPVADTPHIDTVLVSHNHADHRNDDDLRFLSDRDHCEIISPMGTGSRLKNGGHRAYDATWWDCFTLSNGIRITFTPAHHSSQTGIWDTQKELWGGFVIQIPTGTDSYYTIYMTGDTAAHLDPESPGFYPCHHDFDLKLFRDIASIFPSIDLMLLPIDPISGEENMHANLHQGIDLLKLLAPSKFIPMHWGTWPYNDLPQDEKVLGPVLALEKLLKEKCPELLSKMLRMNVGETKLLEI